MRTPEYDDIDMALLEWFKLQCNAWLQVQSTTIPNCLRHALEATNSQPDDANEEVEEILENSSCFGETLRPTDITEYQNIDSMVVTAGTEADEDIISRVLGVSEEIESDPETISSK
ncbi:unnamed protein product [Allacma fusca]|uniref:Uncharacterized protein n=1 Tax=Allacma fusca TaxID=39272 RepID=A0A8J2JU64_9HEXA|nr:unnamed protein product [Allacma fusca]